MRVARRVLNPGKGKTFTGREIVASRSGAKSFGAELLLLNAQSFISSLLLTRHIKVHIAQIC